MSERVKRWLALAEHHIEARPGWVLTVLAVLTRAPFLSRAPLSMDETRSVQLAERILGPGGFVGNLAFDVQAPLFPALSAGLVAALGDDGRWLRIPPFLASVATVPILHAVFREWLRPRDAFWAGLAVAFSPFLVFYAKEARPYALAGLAFAAFLLVYVHWAKGRALRFTPVWLTALAALGVASHFIFGLTLLAFLLIVGLAAWLGRDERMRDLLHGTAWILIGCAPLVAIWAYYYVNGAFGYLDWNLSVITPVSLVAEQVFFLTGNSLGSDIRWLHLVLLALLLVPVVTEIAARSHAGEPFDPIVRFLWWVTPAMLLLAQVLVQAPLLYYPRAFLMAAPLLLAPWALGTRRLLRRGGAGRWIAAGGLALFVHLGLLAALSSPWHPEYRVREMVSVYQTDLASRLEPDDAVFVHHEIATSYLAYGYEGPQSMQGLGWVAMTSEEFEKVVFIMGQIDDVGPERRIVLIENEMGRGDLIADVVLPALRERRQGETELPCWSDGRPSPGFLCSRILVFDRLGVPAAP